MFIQLLLSALGWATFATLVAQAVSIGVLWWLGLHPRKLSHEIENTQNTAVGACFFIISIAASIFISTISSSGFTSDSTTLDSLIWITLGLVLASIYTWIAFEIAHRAFGKENESLYKYLRRELIDEQNAALAFFLGGLSVAPFIAVTFQII